MRTTCKFNRKSALDLNVLTVVDPKSACCAGNVLMMMNDSISSWLTENKKGLGDSRDYSPM
jgi:hypothetical protein